MSEEMIPPEVAFEEEMTEAAKIQICIDTMRKYINPKFSIKDFPSKGYPEVDRFVHMISDAIEEMRND